jgi:hypothetical protein
MVQKDECMLSYNRLIFNDVFKRWDCFIHIVPNGPCNDGLKRAPIFSSGITSLTASKTSKNIRAFSILPPYHPFYD